MTTLSIAYFWALGHYPLLDPDEPVYAETGKLMALSHSFAAWWTPHYNGGLWFDKPPFTYWLIGLSMKLLGATELAARVPVALGGLLLVYLTARLAWRLYPHSGKTSIWAALVIGTCLQTLVLSHACVTDVLFVAALVAALMGVWEWIGGTTKSIQPILWAGVAVGVATLTKGPVAIVLVGGQVLTYLLATRQARRLLDPRIWLSLLIALAVAGPWYLSMVHLHGRAFIDSFLEAQNVGRYLSAEHRATASPLFFIPVLLGFFLPWTLAMLPALAASFRRARVGERADLFALIWIALVFVFFSASQSKLVTYIYPLYPLAACIVGNWIGSTRKPTIADRAIAAVSGLLSPLLIGLAMGYGLRLRWFSAEEVAVSLAALCLTAAIAVLVMRDTRAGDRANPPTVQAYFAVGAVSVLILFAAVTSSSYWRYPDPKSVSAVDMGKAIAANCRPSDIVYALTFDKPSLVYYSDRRIVYTDDQQLVGPLLGKPPYPLCVTKPDIVESLLKKRLLGPYKTVAQIDGRVVLIQCRKG